MFWSGPNDAPGDRPWQTWNVLVHSQNMAARQPTSQKRRADTGSFLPGSPGK